MPQIIRHPLENIRNVLKMASSPDVDSITRGEQAVQMLKQYCEKSDPTSALEVRNLNKTKIQRVGTTSTFLAC